MPPSLPHISGADAIRALQKLGFVIARQKGSHVVLRRGSTGCVVPNHREIKIGTLSSVLKQAGISADEFMSAL
ncbi:MAG: type II toxin-antitoxin system HicA family toxin [Gammaproteobacteria bacterium]|nr:type II toxin-antitoxin system HicA family toxin [Gammaproteobacteria bacterium]